MLGKSYRVGNMNSVIEIEDLTKEFDGLVVFVG
jgi:hypothetical protein